MLKYLSILLLFFCFSCQSGRSIIKENLIIVVYPNDPDSEIKASAMPELKPDSRLMTYRSRFEFLLMNVSAMHQPENAKRRTEIWNLYPDTSKLKRLYLNEFAKDKKLAGYFKETADPIIDKHEKISKTFTEEELMNVASKFFYCDQVFPDTSVQSHVCIIINGMKETNWEKDYTLLEAFCYEAIFDDFAKDTSLIDQSYDAEKQKAIQRYRSEIIALDLYLEDVKQDLFERMKNSADLKKALLEYYELNESNLAFRII